MTLFASHSSPGTLSIVVQIKTRNCEKLFLSGSISRLNEFWQNCMLCVFLLDLPRGKHSFIPDRKSERIQSLAFPSFIFHLMWIWCTLKWHAQIHVQSLPSSWSLWTCGMWVTPSNWWLMRVYVKVQLVSLGKENVCFNLKLETTVLSTTVIIWRISYCVLKLYTGTLPL